MYFKGCIYIIKPREKTVVKADEFIMYIYSVHKMKVTKNCMPANPSSIKCLGGPLA